MYTTAPERYITIGIKIIPNHKGILASLIKDKECLRF